MEITNSNQIRTPVKSIDRVIGHKTVIERLIKIAAIQRRNLLLIGVPGIGKSMIAKALSEFLPKPKEEVYIYENPDNPDRPLIHVERYTDEEVDELLNEFKPVGVNINPMELPTRILDELNFRCRYCHVLSNSDLVLCTNCGKIKNQLNVTKRDINNNKMIDLLFNNEQAMENHTPKFVQVTTKIANEENIVEGLYERAGGIVKRYSTLSSKIKLNSIRPNSRLLLPLRTSRYVHAIASTETELLGDNKHDPYGGDKNIGMPSYKKVVLGAIHEAHEGVLFIDEVGTLQETQKDLLIAIQNKVFPITGKNSRSSGSSVKVENVPCDFILVLACNLSDLSKLSSPLRSRIQGYGYEILLRSAMPITDEAIMDYYTFIAQEVENAGNIPHFTRDAMDAIVEEGEQVALRDGFKNSLTLKLRQIGGLIRLAGDYAKVNGHEFVTRQILNEATRLLPDLSTQIKETYGSFEKAIMYENKITNPEDFEYDNDYL